MNTTLGTIHKAAREAIRKIRTISNGGIEREARELASLVAPSSLQIDDGLGYAGFSSSELGFGPAVSKLADLSASWKSDLTRGARSKKAKEKDFMFYLLRSEDLFDIPEVMDIVFNKELYGAITKYLGQVPWLVTIKVWWTLPNQSAIRSQLYHYDHRDTRQAKVFINLNNVGKNSGPLHFLPASSSLQVDRKIGYSHGDYSDEDVYSCCPREKVLTTEGPAGSGYIVDTARCLHYGSRGNELERLVLMISYSRANCVDSGPECEVLGPVRERLIRERYSKDKARSFSLKKL